MVVAVTVLTIIGCLFLLYILIQILTDYRKIVYIGDENKCLVYEEGDIKVTGRPDYIKRQDNNYIPYEYKSFKIKSQDAYLDHKLQLACYMRLIEKTFGQRPDYGIITYGNNRIFRINNTSELQLRLDKNIQRLKELKTGRTTPVRNHCIFEKCLACRYNSVCKHRLEKKIQTVKDENYTNKVEP